MKTDFHEFRDVVDVVSHLVDDGIDLTKVFCFDDQLFVDLEEGKGDPEQHL